MDKLFDKAPQIIEQAAKSPLALLALTIIALSVLAFLLFRGASERIRVRMFVLLFVGVLLLGIALFGLISQSPTIPPAPEESINQFTRTKPAERMVSHESIGQLGEKELSKRQAELDTKIREIEKLLNKQKDQEQETHKVRNFQAQYSNIAGTWRGAAGLSYVVQQIGNSVIIQEINPIFGVTAVGRGEMNQQIIEISYTTALGTSGRASLKVSADGRQMTGTFTDLNTGMSVPAALYR